MPAFERDPSFLKFYKSLEEAIANEMPSVTKLPDWRFIQQKPDETFRQITNCDTGVGFVGGFTAELVNCSGVVRYDVTDNFYYEQRLDSKGVNQIAFEFGMTGIDEPSTFFFLKLTDTVNSDVWFSYPFMITSYNAHLSTKFTYRSEVKKFGISYDLLPYHQTIRIANCWQDKPVNKKEVSQYVLSSGNQVNYDSRPTFLKNFKIDRIDDFINDRLDVLFSHEFVYIDAIRATISDFKTGERKGDVNWLIGSEFNVNFQNERLTETFEIYQYLRLATQYPRHNSTYNTATVNEIRGEFNKPITFNGGTIKLYLGNTLIDEFNETDMSITDSEFVISITTLSTVGDYFVVLPYGLFKNGSEFSDAKSYGSWRFTIGNGDYNSSDYNNNDYFV